MNQDSDIGRTVILNRDRRFQCGGTSFDCFAGKVVWVKQEDANNRKVLLDFSGGLQDWFHESVLDDFRDLPKHWSA